MNKVYLYTNLALTLVLPLVSAMAAIMFFHAGGSAWSLGGEWFIFWAVGIRLFVAGIKQATQPAFTAQEIFRITNPEAQIIVRELGFANICIGLAAALSLFIPAWRIPAAFTGGLYFGIAGAMHVVKGPASPNEKLALYSDLFIFAVVAAYELQSMV